MFEVVQMCNRERKSSAKMVSTDQEPWREKLFNTKSLSAYVVVNMFHVLLCLFFFKDMPCKQYNTSITMSKNMQIQLQSSVFRNTPYFLHPFWEECIRSMLSPVSHA